MYVRVCVRACVRASESASCTRFLTVQDPSVSKRLATEWKTGNLVIFVAGGEGLLFTLHPALGPTENNQWVLNRD
jgi:hypothetical protein